MKRIQTYVLNCTVKPRYSGEKAYATPPATAKKAPHCHARQYWLKGSELVERVSDDGETIAR